MPASAAVSEFDSGLEGLEAAKNKAKAENNKRHQHLAKEVKGSKGKKKGGGKKANKK